MAKLIYLDCNSTTPVDPRVLKVMLPYFTEHFGNPSSATHAVGWHAAEAVQVAREQTAHAIGAEPAEILFTSGATEANNLALSGAVRRSGKRKLISVETEHSSVLGPLKHLAREGFEVILLPVQRDGSLDMEVYQAALAAGDAGLVSVMLANNEIGTLHPIAELCLRAHEAGAAFHCDATQALGKIPIEAANWNVDLLSISAHKAYGPKGAGALCCRNGFLRRIEPLVFGGEQEHELRPGTLNVPAIVGFGEAARLAEDELRHDAARLQSLGRRLLDLLAAEISELELNGPRAQRLPGNLNVMLPGVDAGRLLAALAGKVALSAGSACFSGSKKPSHVLSAIGLKDPGLKQSVRIGLGRFTLESEIEEAALIISSAAQRLSLRS